MGSQGKDFPWHCQALWKAKIDLFASRINKESDPLCVMETRPWGAICGCFLPLLVWSASYFVVCRRSKWARGEGLWFSQFGRPNTSVSKNDAPVVQHATNVTSNNKDTVSSQQAQSTTPTGEQTEMNCMHVIGESFTKQGISAEAAQVILKSWRKGTSKQYHCYFKNGLTSVVENRLVQIVPL